MKTSAERKEGLECIFLQIKFSSWVTWFLQLVVLLAVLYLSGCTLPVYECRKEYGYTCGKEYAYGWTSCIFEGDKKCCSYEIDTCRPIKEPK